MQESMDTILVYGKNDFENDLEGDFRIETNNLYFAEMLGKCCYNVSKLCDHFVKRSDKTLSLSLFPSTLENLEIPAEESRRNSITRAIMGQSAADFFSKAGILTFRRGCFCPAGGQATAESRTQKCFFRVC